jgi:serine protease Do/serine protease DegQ
VAQLRETAAEVKRGTTGVILGSLNAERFLGLGLASCARAVVEDVAPGLFGRGWGLRRGGDVITRIQNRPVSNAGTVAATVGIAAPGTRVAVVHSAATAARAGPP